MSRLYFEALSRIPESFVDDGTQVMEYRGSVILVNPELVPMFYRDGVWLDLEPIHCEDIIQPSRKG